MTSDFITNYDFGRITIENKTYISDVIILGKEVTPNWWRNKGHSLTSEDLEKVINYKPELLILGTGYYGLMKVPSELTKKLNFKVASYNTKEALILYNKEINKTKKIAGAFHISC